MGGSAHGSSSRLISEKSDGQLKKKILRGNHEHRERERQKERERGRERKKEKERKKERKRERERACVCVCIYINIHIYKYTYKYTYIYACVSVSVCDKAVNSIFPGQLPEERAEEPSYRSKQDKAQGPTRRQIECSF